MLLTGISKKIECTGAKPLGDYKQPAATGANKMVALVSQECPAAASDVDYDSSVVNGYLSSKIDDSNDNDPATNDEQQMFPFLSDSSETSISGSIALQGQDQGERVLMQSGEASSADDEIDLASKAIEKLATCLNNLVSSRNAGSLR